MGGAACTRLEACSPDVLAPTPAVSSQSSFQLRATSSFNEGNPEVAQLCGPPSLSEAEKLLLSPLRKRTRTASRLTAELPTGCYEIDPKEIQRGTKIGSGTWSVVFSAEWRGEKTAMKIYRHAGGDVEEQEKRWQMFLKEARMLQQLDSPRMVKLIGVFVGGDACPCLVTELLQGGVLYDWLHGRRRSRKDLLEPAHRFLLGTHISEGIAYLHCLAPSIVHRDLKSKNVVVTSSAEGGAPREAKIIDFGLAHHLDDANLPEERLAAEHSMQGSAVYMSPECFTKPLYLTSKVDVWALGCVLAEIFGGAPPHSECEEFQQVVDKLLVQKRAPDVPAHADLASGLSGDDSIKHMLEGCFEFDVEKRSSAAQVFEKLKALAGDRDFPL